MTVFLFSLIDKCGNIIYSKLNNIDESIDEDELNQILYDSLKIVYDNKSFDIFENTSSLKLNKLFAIRNEFNSFNSFIITNNEKIQIEIYFLCLKLEKELGHFFQSEEFNLSQNSLINEKIEKILFEDKGIISFTPKEPTKILDPVAIFNLHPTLQDTALSVLYHQSATLDKIHKDSKNSRGDVKRELELLTNMGYLGQKLDDSGKIIYYCKS